MWRIIENSGFQNNGIIEINGLNLESTSSKDCSRVFFTTGSLKTTDGSKTIVLKTELKCSDGGSQNSVSAAASLENFAFSYEDGDNIAIGNLTAMVYSKLKDDLIPYHGKSFILELSNPNTSQGLGSEVGAAPPYKWKKAIQGTLKLLLGSYGTEWNCELVTIGENVRNAQICCNGVVFQKGDYSFNFDGLLQNKTWEVK